MNRARASEIRMRQPPENEVVGCSCISDVKPRPARMRRARGSALWTPWIRISVVTSLYSFIYLTHPSQSYDRLLVFVLLPGLRLKNGAQLLLTLQ